ncbi:hypothetical protein FG386_002890 [Cryptosporidium ryanae]|uniref:uncharacterized protein n=1 Tax=Cryptosporidium ryanae TaxID=515981 RepID=UPI00351A7953|nr:hypothetical protein FG386_002890 [Cryptosporidium ryanae]
MSKFIKKNCNQYWQKNKSLVLARVNGDNTSKVVVTSQDNREVIDTIGDINFGENLKGSNVIRSLLSLVNIQIDLWENSFTDGFSSIMFEDERSGFLHNLSESLPFRIGSDEYMIVSRNKPEYDSLIIYYEDIYENGSGITNNTKKSDNLFVVLNETENELIISSSKISSGSVCMGLLNGTEIWSPEFCEIVSNVNKVSESENVTDSSGQFNSDIYCFCYGAFIYTISEPQINNRLLQNEGNVFNFPDVNGEKTNIEIQHVNDLFLKKVTREDNKEGNHGDNIPFPPLHSTLGGRIISNGKIMSDKHDIKKEVSYIGLGDIISNQDEIYAYYGGGNFSPKYNKYRSSRGNRVYNDHKISEINIQGKVNMEIEKARIKNSINKSTDPVTNFVKNNSNTNANTNLKLNIKDIKGNMGDVKLITPIIDSISVFMEINNLNANTIFNSKINKEKFIYSFVSVLSRALFINPGKAKVIQLVSGEETNLLRGVISSLIKLTVNIKTNESERLVTQIKNMHNEASEFNRVFSYKVISIEKKSGSKSISSEVVTDVGNQVLKRNNTNNEGVFNLLPIIFRMELKAKKAFMNQRDAFDLFEDELAKSMNISKDQIDIPEFNYKQVNDSLTNETFLIINTETWIHPLKPTREEYVNLLSNIYSNIIHSRTSSFSSLFICIKYEVKQIPRIRNQQKQSEHNKNRIGDKSKSHTNVEQNLIEEGRISKIGKYFKYDNETRKNKENSGVNQETNHNNNKDRIELSNEDHLSKNRIVYLIK